MRKAFSLVELSIVLVILGLLVGGILTGRSLIRAAELRTVASDLMRYQAAMYSFRDKYQYLPGDIPNAVRFWGAQAGGTADGPDATCANLGAEATGTATCNGDGSGFIADGIMPDNNPIYRLQWYEGFRAWQHLANANLISGKYWGNSTSGSRDHRFAEAGINVPAAKIGKNSLWLILSYTTPYPAWSEYFDMPAGSYIKLTTILNTWDESPVLRPEEAWNIDTKLDDGMPAKGFIVSHPGTSATFTNCTVDGSATTTYMLTNSNISCSLHIRIN